MTNTKRKGILVLGMHRSGTSALTRAINLAGVDLPKNLMAPGKENKTGYWEPEKLAELHERMLAEAGSSWSDWRKFDLTNLGQARAQYYHSEILQQISDDYPTSSLFVLKDPRIGRFAPLYLKAFEELMVSPYVIFPFRNPLEVAKSIEKRDNYSTGISQLIWLRNVLDAEKATRASPRVFVAYEKFLSDWRKELGRISNQLELTWPNQQENYENELDEFLNPEFQNSHFTLSDLNASDEIGEWVITTYNCLHKFEKNPYDEKSMQILDAVLARFDEACGHFGTTYTALATANGQLMNLAEAQLVLDKNLLELERGNLNNISLRKKVEKSNSILKRDNKRLEKENINVASANKNMQQTIINRDAQYSDLKAANQTLLAKVELNSQIETFEINSISPNESHQYLENSTKIMRKYKNWRHRGITYFQRAQSYRKRNGTIALIERVRQGVIERVKRDLNKNKIPKIAKPADASTLVSQVYPYLAALGSYSATTGLRRITLIVDGTSSGYLYGGLATTIILGTQLAKSANSQLRIVTRNQIPVAHNVAEILKCNNIEYDFDIEFVYCPLDGSSQLETHENDVFITTSWWTTVAALKSIDISKVIYLIQEDERMFYPYGDEQRRCREVFNQKNLQYVVNSKLLFEHFEQCGDNLVAEQGTWFEPAFSDKSYFIEEKSNSKKQFFFYARPNNLRNLFLLGLEAIDTAVTERVLDPQEWEFIFVGKDIPPVSLGRGVNISRLENLTWSKYASFVRGVDLALSLMYTPHPSYPPLDVAASGGVVVTNRFGVKQSLDKYSSNIICTDPDVSSLVDGLKRGVLLVNDKKTRQKNFNENKLTTNWADALGPTVKQLKKIWANVPE